MSDGAVFSFEQKILFKHCDPAGIVFYPRFAEILNDAVEAFFAARLAWPFETLHPDYGVPTAALSFRFRKPCRHGDHLQLRLHLAKLGHSSLTLQTCAMRGVEECFFADQTLVCVDADGHPTPWPDPVRARVTKLMEAT